MARLKIHPPEEWNQQRHRITELYRIEDLTLREVMNTMRQEHNFNASVKMYKSRIAAWRLDKKNKTYEACVIMREKERSDAWQQHCLFFVRRFLVDVNDVERYCVRSKLEVGTEDILLPADVQILMLRRKLTALSDPINFKHLRSFFYYYGVLVESCFDQSIWTKRLTGRLHGSLASDTVDSCKLVEQSFLNLGTARQFFTRSEHQKGGVYLRSAFWRFPEILRSTYHETIPCLYSASLSLVATAWETLSNVSSGI